MASIKRSFKLQELVAHNASVNCLALGRKSGRVMVTGGDDKKVNLWAIGKEKCFMSLSGHTTPVECVQFNHVEELVCSGSSAGSLKVWDLENLKLIRTLNGHRDAIKCIDFHPLEDFVASGSADSSIKFWDSRKKGCLFTYQGHNLSVNSIKFSPDGNWIASCSEDTSVKIWDIRIGRVLKEFKGHNTSVTCIEFHPHEFLLATSGEDRTVNFYDLESFQLVSSENNVGPIRSICFNPDGECLFTGMRDTLKVVGWEPNRIYDVVPINWGRVCDISIASNQLIGASYHLTNVTVYVVDLKTIKPLCNNANDLSSGPFRPNQSIRKSFSKAESHACLRNKTTLDVKTIEESTSGTDPEEETLADITVVSDYNEIFKGRRQLTRTPPPEPEPFTEPISEPVADNYLVPQILTSEAETLEALSLDNNINYKVNKEPVVSSPYSRSKSNLEQVYANKKVTQQNLLNTTKSKTNIGSKYNLQRQSSCKENSEKTPRNDIKQSRSDASINRNSNAIPKLFSKRNLSSIKTHSSPNISKSNLNEKNNIKQSNIKSNQIIMLTSNYSSSTITTAIQKRDSPDDSPISDEYLPNELDRPVGLTLEEFLPKTHSILNADNKQLPEMSEVEALGVLERGHESTMAIVHTRCRNLKLVFTQFRNNDLKSAIETAISLADYSIIVDILGLINNKYTLWNLDVCVILLPQIEEILQSKFEKYITTACNSVLLILRHFGPVIKENTHSPAGSFGVDLTREERYKKSIKCHETLLRIRTFINKKHLSSKGNLGNIFKEIHMLMKNID